MTFNSVLQQLMHAGPGFPVHATWNYACERIVHAFHQMSSVAVFSSFANSLLQDPYHLIELYKKTDPLETAVYVSSGLSVIHYILSEITKNYSQVGKSIYTSVWSVH